MMLPVRKNTLNGSHFLCKKIAEILKLLLRDQTAENISCCLLGKFSYASIGNHNIIPPMLTNEMIYVTYNSSNFTRY